MPAHTINAADDRLIGFAEASQILGVSPTSIWRWAIHGANGTRLRYVRVGRRLRTTRQALSQFCADLAEADKEREFAPVRGWSK